MPKALRLEITLPKKKEKNKKVAVLLMGSLQVCCILSLSIIALETEFCWVFTEASLQLRCANGCSAWLPRVSLYALHSRGESNTTRPLVICCDSPNQSAHTLRKPFVITCQTHLGWCLQSYRIPVDTVGYGQADSLWDSNNWSWQQLQDQGQGRVTLSSAEAAARCSL